MSVPSPHIRFDWNALGWQRFRRGPAIFFLLLVFPAAAWSQADTSQPIDSSATANAEAQVVAEALPQTDWRRLERPAQYEVKTEPRAKRDNVKEQVVRDKKFKNFILQWEDVAEFKYQPFACKQTYRMIALRKRISVEQGQEKLFEEYRYFFYITNDLASTAEQVVFEANDRCDQEK